MEKMYKNLPVLVTGGCGFIGSHLTKKLVLLGAQVTVLDNCSTSHPLYSPAFEDSVTFIHKSITDPHACLEATLGKKIVFHQAALASAPLSLENPSLCHQLNVEGTFNLLEASRLHGVERFVFASSAAVYGNHHGVCVENAPVEPQSPYGYSKLMGEIYCRQYANLYGLNTVCLRYCNVYGEGQNPHSPYATAVAIFKDRMKHNQPITIYGDGSQTRDFIPVEAIVEANVRLGMLSAQHMRGDVYNIGSGLSITLLDLIDLLKKEFPTYTAPLIFEPEQPGDVKHVRTDCSKYLSLIS